ncbi:MAG: amidase [Hyphomicrobiaceae bacterium]
MDVDALQRLTATTAAELIASGQISSEELVSACLARISTRDGEVKAWAHVDPELALLRARAADNHRRSGRGLGALHGVPIGIKDIIDTADQPTENGSAAFIGRRPEQDAACVAALKAAGAIILGKTITTELATSTPSITRNPRNLGHTPGGSSAGSAAAVADLMVPVALGTQTAGSVIRPASYCGVFGFKPSFGLIPRTGILTYAHSLDTVGVLARSIEDLALLADVLQAYDSADPASADRVRPPITPTATMDWPLPPRFAWVTGPAWTTVDSLAQEAFSELAEALGNDIVAADIDLTIEAAVAATRTVQSFERTHHFGPLLARHADRISTRLAAEIEAGRHITIADYNRALTAADGLRAALEPLFSDHGTILTAAASGPAPSGLKTTGDPVFNGLWTFLGLPAVTLPLLECDGLPVGVQLVGAHGDDGRLLRTARLLTERLQNAPA